MKRDAAGMKPPEAAAMIKRFLERYSIESCVPDQLLALADLALRAKELATAREVLGRAMQAPDRLHLAAYKLGRVELLCSNLQAAEALFATGSQAEPSFPFNWMGLARVYHSLGRPDEAAAAAERFVTFGIRPHAPEELVALAQIADFLFESGQRQRSGPIFALVSRLGSPHPRVTVRLAEALMAAGDFAGALALLRPAHADGALDLWGRRALAQCESLAGDPVGAIALAEDVLAERPFDEGFVATYADALIRSRRVDLWRDAAERLGKTLPNDLAMEIAARIALVDGDIDRVFGCLQDVMLRPHSRLFYLALETAYAALDKRGFAMADELCDRLCAVAPNEAASLLLSVDISLRQQNWDRAADALFRLPPDQADRPDIVLKWFEYHCFVGNKAEAEALAAKLDRMQLGRQHTLPLLRFLAEQQKWSELVDRAIGWLGDDFNYAQIGYVLFRAAKHTKRQADFLAAIEAIPGWSVSQDLVRLHTTLGWDRATTVEDMDQVTRGAPLPPSPALRRRMEVQRQILARASGKAKRRALFLCTNRNYLCATVVALHSALRPSAPGREDIFLVVDDETAGLTERLMGPFRDRGFSVTVVPASEVVEEAEKLYPTYGLFTSGHVLASAAYYRIYFARHLQKTGRYERAIYIDSDVLVRVTLDTLFAVDLQGHPLAARVETPRPEVTRAIELHGLPGDMYFNSGILLFDMTSDVLAPSLDGAVAAIMDDDTTLLFHDQCALNLGFRERFKPMAIEWNLPIGEATEISDLPENAAILHYLDRPKPWSAAYGGECGTLWFDEWRDTAALIGEAAAIELFSLCND
jgi:lipopolysaccharide biosynthesis glycosyltransferase